MDWRKVWVVARHEYLTSIRRAGFIIFTLILPLIGLVALLAGIFFAGRAGDVGAFFAEQFDAGSKDIGVVDRSGKFSSILESYQENFHLYDSREVAEAALTAEEVSSVLVIGEDYLETGRIVVVTRGSGFAAAAIEDSQRVQAFFVAHLLEDEDVAPSLRERVAHPLEMMEPEVLSPSGEARGGGFLFTFVIPYFLSIFLVTSIFVSSGYLLQSVAEEKESRVIEIVVSSVTPAELMAGKVAGLGALGLTQLLIWMASAAAFGGGAVAVLALAGAVSIPTRVLILGVIYYLLGYILYATLMAGVGALGTTARESQQLAGIFSFFAAVPYMFSGFLFANPNMGIARVLSFFPLTAPTMMMMRLPLAEVSWVDVAGSIAVLLVSIPVALWAGAKLFRVGMLIYGKRPTLREIWLILRGER